MKTRITRTLTSLALATALLSGSSAAFAATPDVASPALYDLGQLGDLGLPGADLGALGDAGDIGSHVAGALDIGSSAAGVVPPIVQNVAPIPHQAAATGVGIASSAIPGVGLPGLPGLPFGLP